MSIFLRNDVKVRIEQMKGENAPRPLPLISGFNAESEYLVLGLHCPSESGEAFCILKNDRDEMWFISNRHLRITSVGSLRFQESETLQLNKNGNH